MLDKGHPLINALTILGLSLGIMSGSVYVRTRLGPFCQLQRAATFARACVICAGKVAPAVVGNWRWYWPDAVREAKEGR